MKKSRPDIEGQPFLVTPDCDWRPPNMGELPTWGSAKMVAIDCETCDPTLKALGPGVRRDGRVVGISFALGSDQQYYLPFGHQEPTDNLEVRAVKRYLLDQAVQFTGALVVANGQYDLDYLDQMGITFPFVKAIRDVQLAAPLLNELHSSYSLDAIAKRLGLAGKEETALIEAALFYRVDPKAGLWKLPARYVGAYAEQDARLTLEVYRRQVPLLQREGLWDIFELESAVLPALLRMRQRGLRVDRDRLDRVEQSAYSEAQEHFKRISELSGVRVTLDACNNTRALAHMLSTAGYEVPRTEKDNLSVTDEWLRDLPGEIPRHLRRARKLDKLCSTFVTSLRDHLVGDRVHCNYNQLRRERETGDTVGAAYGRLSCEHPNMQQQPRRDPQLGKLWRSIYLPEEGCQLLSTDYASQEPRMAVHWATRLGCTGADVLSAAYSENPDLDLHGALAQHLGWINAQGRDRAKTIFLGLCYGMGVPKLCAQIGLPLETYEREQNSAGQHAIDRFTAMVPFITQLSEHFTQVASTQGYVRTILGRRCRFPRLAWGRYDWTHKALNRVIQGSSADQSKQALVDLDAAGLLCHLQLHDEFLTSVPDEMTAHQVVEIMEAAVPLSIPVRASAKIGPDWGNLITLPRRNEP